MVAYLLLEFVVATAFLALLIVRLGLNPLDDWLHQKH